MVFKGATDERLRAFFNLATYAPPGEALNASSEDEKKKEGDTREMTQEQLKRLMLETYQIPFEKCVLVVEDATPTSESLSSADVRAVCTSPSTKKA
ncbi:hypothetical protein PR002_g2179 [Phytophthora rubi]|nr:hypothetical protein PR002_g2179 [Phytophthora rubi]